jgi:hypothetical protein
MSGIRTSSTQVVTGAVAIEIVVIRIIVMVAPSVPLLIRRRRSPVLVFDNTYLNHISQAGQSVEHSLSSTQGEGVARDEHIRFRNEDDLLLRNEPWVLTPCRHEEFSVVINWGDLRWRELDASTGGAQDGLYHVGVPRVQGDVPHPNQDSELEEVGSGERRPSPGMPNQGEGGVDHRRAQHRFPVFRA